MVRALGSHKPVLRLSLVTEGSPGHRSSAASAVKWGCWEQGPQSAPRVGRQPTALKRCEQRARNIVSLITCTPVTLGELEGGDLGFESLLAGGASPPQSAIWEVPGRQDPFVDFAALARLTSRISLVAQGNPFGRASCLEKRGTVRGPYLITPAAPPASTLRNSGHGAVPSLGQWFTSPQ